MNYLTTGNDLQDLKVEITDSGSVVFLECVTLGEDFEKANGQLLDVADCLEGVYYELGPGIYTAKIRWIHIKGEEKFLDIVEIG